MMQTDKMLSRKEGGVGYMTFNNPERHNAVSLDMWEAAQGILADFAADKAVRELGWKPKFPKLEDIITTAWAWHVKNPNGYAD